ncbi:LLM class flavin-dependent oxidoreductase [Amycolatopsis sacchari]|uniref:LLM class flavin-dependent oxidoreductase n=1 Tax=Amycolatopsis sacchari TaxID=115433 RepID=UPI003D75A542
MRIGTSTINSATPGDYAAGAADAARRGFDSFWTNQLPGGWDPFVTLAGFRERPREIGTAVALTYPRHPATLAAEALTLQAATGGGLVLGVGAGHEWYVQGQLGLSYASPLRHTREYLTVLRPLLRGEQVDHEGEYFTVHTRLNVEASAPPVLMAALGPRMLALAGELTDGVVSTWVTPEVVADQVAPSLPAGARIVVGVVVSVTDEPDRVRERLAADFGGVGELPAYRASLARAGLSSPADATVLGNEAAVGEAIARFRDAGTTDLVVIPLGSPEEQARTLDVVATFKN